MCQTHRFSHLHAARPPFFPLSCRVRTISSIFMPHADHVLHFCTAFAPYLPFTCRACINSSIHMLCAHQFFHSRAVRASILPFSRLSTPTITAVLPPLFYIIDRTKVFRLPPLHVSFSTSLARNGETGKASCASLSACGGATGNSTGLYNRRRRV